MAAEDGVLEPALSETPAIVQEQLTRRRLTEAFVRIVISTLLLPDYRATSVPDLLAALWGPRAGIEAQADAASTGRGRR